MDLNPWKWFSFLKDMHVCASPNLIKHQEGMSVRVCSKPQQETKIHFAEMQLCQ